MATIDTTGYASDVIVGSALPQEMDYRLPASLPAAKNFEIRIQPINAQSFIGGNVVQIDLPCGRPGQYLDPSTTYIRFKATYTAGTVTTNQARFLGSSPYSYWQKQEVYGNNSVILESINEINVLANAMTNLQLNDSDQRGLSTAFGGDYTTVGGSSATAGHLINVNTAGAGVLDAQTFDYAVNLIGILGSGTSDKMIPIGEVYGLRYELTMDNFTNFTRTTAGAGVTGCTISDFEFVANIIELSPEANALIIQQNPDKIRIRSQTYRQSSNTLGSQGVAATTGTNDLLVGIRVSSLKSIFMCCSPSDANEKKFAGVNPNLDQGTCYLIGGGQYPQRTLNPSLKTADTYFETQKALGALGYSVFNGCISKGAWSVSSTAYGQCAVYNTTVADIMTKPNQFYLGIDVETISRKNNLLSGINVNSSPMFFRAQVGQNLAAVTHTLNFFGYYDVILEIDRAQKNIVAKF